MTSALNGFKNSTRLKMAGQLKKVASFVYFVYKLKCVFNFISQYALYTLNCQEERSPYEIPIIAPRRYLLQSNSCVHRLHINRYLLFYFKFYLYSYKVHFWLWIGQFPLIRAPYRRWQYKQRRLRENPRHAPHSEAAITFIIYTSAREFLSKQSKSRI